MSKALSVLLELKDCSDYWSEYFVPLGIHERIDDAIKELLAQPEQENLTPRQGLKEYKKGYAQAELDLKREPLSADKIWSFSHLLFFDAMRQLEKAHGITGGKE